MKATEKLREEGWARGRDFLTRRTGSLSDSQMGDKNHRSLGIGSKSSLLIRIAKQVQENKFILSGVESRRTSCIVPYYEI